MIDTVPGAIVRIGHVMNSVTSAIRFIGVNFRFLNAFYIVFCISTNKKGISTTKLRRCLAVRQKISRLFRQKVMKAKELSSDFLMKGTVEVDETYMGGQDDKSWAA